MWENMIGNRQATASNTAHALCWLDKWTYRHTLGTYSIIVVCFILGNSPASEIYMLTFRNTLFHLHRQICMKYEVYFILHTYAPMKMFRNVGTQNSDAGELPTRNHTIVTYNLPAKQFFICFNTFHIACSNYIYKIQGVPLATESGISLIILTPMKILQRNLNWSAFVVWEMKRNVSVVRFKFRCNILSGKIILKKFRVR